jgi:hypothetical protein
MDARFPEIQARFAEMEARFAEMSISPNLGKSREISPKTLVVNFSANKPYANTHSS